MRQTVYFATNRTVTDAADAVNGYPATMVPPLNPAAITYGVAFIDGVDLNSGAQGQVLAITET
jgi:hypothetical protein